MANTIRVISFVRVVAGTPVPRKINFVQVFMLVFCFVDWVEILI